LKLLFVGDVMLGRLVNETLKTAPPDYPWGNVLSVFQKADVRIANIECVISDLGNPWTVTPKVFRFRSDAKNIEALRIAQINAVSLANNHSLDFEYEAMFEMIKLLDEAGISHAGAGANLEEASRPALWETNGIRIGLIAFTDNEPDWGATDHRPGIFYLPIDREDGRAKRLFEIVHDTQKEVDLLIVSAHWGPNWGHRPRRNHIPFGHALIDRGADIVFGHSCHVFQGIEIYQGRLILYSTGDFIDDYAVDEVERNDESFIFMVQMEKEKITRLHLYPTLVRNFQARLAVRSEAPKIARKMKNLCAEFNTLVRWDDDEQRLEIFPT
jgi:poly-gamma-glutamate synthesis protein (capsule biosynthesis protein)